MSATYISDQLIQGIGITLVHSIWQGLLIAVLLKVVLYLVPQSRVQLKYWLSVTALTAVVFWAGYTFNIQVFPLTGSSASGTAQVIDLSYSSAIQSVNAIRWNEVKPLLQRIEVLSAPYFNTMVVLWMLGVAFFLVRLQGSIFYLQKMRKVGTKPVPVYWQQKAEQLADKLGVRNRIRLIESKLAEVPMVIGHLKPVILIPVGMISGLSAREVEAILAHELAHIKRYDYLINIVQTVIESLLFFNPSIWWISQTIRKSREHCCDDIAVRYCGDQLVYANALSNLGAWSLKAPSLSMGLFKNRNELLMRIKRLVYPQVGNQTVKEKLFPGMVLVFTVICLSWYSHRVQAQLVPAQGPTQSVKDTQKTNSSAVVPDSIPPVVEEHVEVLPPMEPLEEFDEEFEELVEIHPDVDVDLDVDFEFDSPDVEFYGDFGDFEVDVMVSPPVVFEDEFNLSPDEYSVVVPEVFADEFEAPGAFIDMDIEAFADPEQFQHIVEDIHVQFDDTTRERIMQALEAQREALERAKEEQALALEKARDQLRKSLESERPEDLTEEEWEMAKRKIEEAERSLDRAMRQSERALERALMDQESDYSKQIELATREAGRNRIVIRQQFKDVNEEHLKRQIADAHAMARVHRHADAQQYKLEYRVSGNESKLRKTLWNDGLIDNVDSDICLTFNRSQIKINDVKLEGDVKQKYREMLDDMYGKNSTGSLTFSD